MGESRINSQDCTVLILIPTYNEVENIKPLLQRISTSLPGAHCLFIDDNSSDGTQERINQSKLLFPSLSIHLLKRAAKQGLARAYIAGFRWGLEQGYQAFIQLDGDLSHDPHHIPSMLQALDNADFVIGSRYVKGGGIKNWGRLRRCLSRFGSFYARQILNTSISDFTGGYNAWTADVIKAIDFDDFLSTGYVFLVELKYRAIQLGFKCLEVPIVFVDREHGTSKLSVNIAIEAMINILKLRFSGISQKLNDEAT